MIHLAQEVLKCQNNMIIKILEVEEFYYFYHFLKETMPIMNMPTICWPRDKVVDNASTMAGTAGKLTSTVNAARPVRKPRGRRSPIPAVRTPSSSLRTAPRSPSSKAGIS